MNGEINTDRKEIFHSRRLEDVLGEYGEYYEAVADTNAPLKQDELPQLQETHEAEYITWPDTDSYPLFAGNDFPSGEAGDRVFYNRAVEFKGTHPQGLNNFWAILKTKPYRFDGQPSDNMLSMAYATMPAKIRAHLAFPELMGALSQKLDGRPPFEACELVEDDPYFRQGARLAFGIMRRLMRADDPELQARLQAEMLDMPFDEQQRYHEIVDPNEELCA